MSIITIDSYLANAENSVSQDSKFNSTLFQIHPLCKDILTVIDELSQENKKKNIRGQKALTIKSLAEKLSDREIYTLRKILLSNLISAAMGEKDDASFVENKTTIKLTKDSPSNLANHLKKGETAYITFNVIPMSFAKLSQKTTFMEANGKSCDLAYQFQKHINVVSQYTGIDENPIIAWDVYFNVLITKS